MLKRKILVTMYGIHRIASSRVMFFTSVKETAVAGFSCLAPPRWPQLP